MRVGIFLAAMLALLGLKLSAADFSTEFDAANKLYEQGRFADAVGAYDKLLATGNSSEAVYFNRGNAFFKLGQLGQSIASYRQAERLAPRDRELRANLQLARTKARGGAPYHPDWFREFLSGLSLNEWTVLTMLAYWALFIFLALGEWRNELKSRLKNFVSVSIAALLLFGLCFGFALYLDFLPSSAIVIAGETDVRNGPLDESPGIFKVRDGAELKVLDRKDNWLQVEDPAQRIGWLRQDNALIFDSTGVHAPKA